VLIFQATNILLQLSFSAAHCINPVESQNGSRRNRDLRARPLDTNLPAWKQSMQQE
jgi:hypothetical protein